MRSARLVSFVALFGCASSPTPAPTQAPASEAPPAVSPAPSDAASAGFPRVAGDGFTFAMPGKVKSGRKTVPVAVGGVSASYSVSVWVSEDAGVHYKLATIDHPAPIYSGGRAEPALAMKRDDMVSEVEGGALAEDEAIVLDGRHPGRAFTISSPSATVKARVYVVGNRLYQLEARHVPSLQATRAGEFLGSLALTTRAPAP